MKSRQKVKNQKSGVKSKVHSLTADIALSERAARAFLYAYSGLEVFPLFGTRGGICRCIEGQNCQQAGKHPRTKRGPKDATTNLFTIKRWWNKWPSANIGIATGNGFACANKAMLQSRS